MTGFVEMNSVQRCLKAIRRESPDRVPVIPLIISHSIQLAGVPYWTYNRDPKVLVDCQVAAWRKYGCDGIHVTTDNWILPQALGVPVQFYPDLPPTGLARPLANTKDLSALPPLTEAKSAARMGLLPEATRYARDLLANTCFIKTNFDQGPFSLASAVRGIEQLMIDMRDDEGFVFDLLGICTEMVCELGLAVGRARSHAVTFGDSVAGLISRNDFIKFAFPFEKEVIRRLQAALDLPVFLHICGRASHILDYMAKTGADVLELDHFNEFAEIKRQVGNVVCVEGNLDPTRVLLQGSSQLVREKSAEIILMAGSEGGLILSSGCEVPPETPPANIQAMVDAARDYAGR
jgi:uroporphyrinogen decarboxylase